MSVSSEFNAAAAALVQSWGASAVYTQGGNQETFNVYIDKELEIVDEEIGTGQVVKAAIIAVGDFPFAGYQPADTITQGGVTYTVTRKLQDDGTYMTLELK